MKKPVASYIAKLSGLDLENLGWVSLLQEQEREDLNHSIGYGDHPKYPAPYCSAYCITDSAGKRGAINGNGPVKCGW